MAWTPPLVQMHTKQIIHAILIYADPVHTRFYDLNTTIKYSTSLLLRSSKVSLAHSQFTHCTTQGIYLQYLTLIYHTNIAQEPIGKNEDPH